MTTSDTQNPHHDEPVLCVKEIADKMGVHVHYVYSMRKAGFRMPGNRATFSEAREWLMAHPDFNTKNAWAKKS
ncbi:MAG: hypothetical protein ABQ298_03665 [Puniceicoccaceae bacterium]